MGIVFFIGYYMIIDYDWNVQDVYMCINILTHAAMAMGHSMSNMPQVNRAKNSAKIIFDIIDEKSTLDVRDGIKAKYQEVNGGSIEFKNVDFKYPSRD